MAATKARVGIGNVDMQKASGRDQDGPILAEESVDVGQGYRDGKAMAVSNRIQDVKEQYHVDEILRG